ncbi:hypothetical protein ACFQ48_10500 [Hymenobacter caeli]|uniref:REase AHJR-like domain-containing protein n=1 Tax=Hymenobacter caeli TaxID=2735894 RepID=A0ABX2FTF8_9BACT|nr:hypothetical protein [Hymenobacter caeli]NRT19727.1 hypothetical protein [Hymenobacter caeli]
MNPSQRQHDIQVAALAESYRQQGYAVTAPPDMESVPFDLNGFRPDLLAEKQGQHLLILANNTQQPISIGRLRELSETIKQQPTPGWRLLLINYSPESVAGGLLQDPISWDNIIQRTGQAKKLREAGEAEAAILLFWSALEALLRRHAESLGFPLEQLSVRALLDYLYSDADLSYEHFDQAKMLLSGRNKVAHGFTLPEASQQANLLQNLIDELSGEWLPMRNVA